MSIKLKRVKGQDTLEYLAVLPMFLLLVWIIIVLAAQWHSYHVTGQIALEAASRSGSAVGAGVARAESIANAQASFTSISISTTDADVESDYSYGKFIGYQSNGTAPMIVGLPWGTSLEEPETRGYTQAPQWEFVACADSCN